MIKTKTNWVAVCQVALTAGVAFAGVSVACFLLREHVVPFHAEAKGYLFSGYLTLGSFLLTTKTFVITRLQEGLFQSKEYCDLHEEASGRKGIKKVGERNEPLRRLTEFLVWSVCLCLITAVLQLVLSALKSFYASTVALGLAAAALALVLRSWLLMRQFMHQYLIVANKKPVSS